AVSVPSGDNSDLNQAFRASNTVFWFAPGVHILGSDEFAQIIPGNGSTYIGAPGAILDGQGVNRYAFTQHATGVRIAYLEIRNFVSPNNEGVVNHDGGAGWLIEHVYIHDNSGAGVFVSNENVLRYSCLRDNGQYGFQGIGPGGGGSGRHLTIEHNEVAHNDTSDLEHVGSGCGCSGGAKLWDVDGATITNNWIHDNLNAGLWVDTNNRNFVIEGNFFDNNFAEAIFYEISYNGQFRHNTFKRNAIGKGQEFAARNDNFPVAAVYVSESGGDARVPGTPSIEIASNYFEDNWGAVTLWEDAERFCGAPNHLNDYCTLVSTDATIATCMPPGIESAPLYDDCRWKTQNVSVHDNEFRVAPAEIGCKNSYCARQAIISNASTADGVPYRGASVEDAITFSRNNHFSNNRYVGPWRFMAHDTSVELDFAEWRMSPYDQDAGSTLSP
ncbi:MAG TPA: right-handed parallel beta-helix repeat-containing protein, partial [Polyangiaceae bacterium]